ncbi:MAG TPA: condensation domain-containing protein, partial [Longimicrobium sp.]|nr:condensation domain-containing protein [Longimicrobium sp.]
AYASSDVLRAEISHWLAQGDEGVAPLPVDGAGEATVADARTVAVQLDEDETRALLQEVPAAYRTQINDVLLCALAESVCGWTGGERIRLSLEGHGREEEVAPGVDLTRTVGWFTSMHPVVLDLAGAAGPGGRLRRVKEQLRAIPRHGIGYGVLRHLSPDADVRARLSAGSEPEISFNYLGQTEQGTPADARLRPANGRRGSESAGGNRRAHLLDVTGAVSGGRLWLGFTYGEGTHRRETVEALASAYVDALRGLIAHCREEGAGGYTPSDFPLVGLTQAELDAAVAGRADVEDLYPLSPLQQGMLFHALYGDDTQEYQTQEAQKLEGVLDAGLFRRAWDEVVGRHPALRTSFVWDGMPRPLQRVERSAVPSWTVEDWRDLPADEQDAALGRYLADDRARGFDLARAPLLRFALFRVADEATWFVWSQHHLITDGWSCVRIADEALRLYQAWRTRTAVELRRTRPYRDYIAWLERQDMGAAERYWHGVLAGFTAPTPLPADRPGSASGIRHARRFAQLPAELTQRVEEAARQKGVTLATVLQGVWGLLLSRWAGEDDVVFGTTVSGRQGPLEGVEEMIGMFINTLPVRMKVPANARLGTWLGELQRAAGEARGYEYASLMQVQGWSEVPRGTPLFESHFILENYPLEPTIAPVADVGSDAGSRPDAAPLRVSARQGVEWNTYPLSLLAAPGTRLLFILSYDEHRFDGESIDRMLGHLVRVLEQVAADPDRRLS